MEYFLVGLGNPGKRYEHTRHNVGRMAVRYVHELCGTEEWKEDARVHALVARGCTKGVANIRFILPNAYMNRSGDSVRPFIKTEGDCARLIVVHDDIDLPAGTVRVVFDRGSGGHNGVRSIETVLKTRAFCRVRIGVLPTTEAGVLEKPKAGTEVEEFILRPLRGTARTDLEQCAQKAHEALLMLMEEGREKTMRAFHAPKEPVKTV